MYDDPGSVTQSGVEEWGEGGTDVGEGENEGDEEDTFGEEEGEGGLDELVLLLTGGLSLTQGIESLQPLSWNRWKQ